MAIIDVIQVLEKDDLNEEQIAKILSELKKDGMVVDYYFVDHQKVWQTAISCGNDLQYFGSGRTLSLALANGLSDWFAEYDTQ